jgi:hypothetical protein
MIGGCDEETADIGNFTRSVGRSISVTGNGGWAKGL